MAAKQQRPQNVAAKPSSKGGNSNNTKSSRNAAGSSGTIKKGKGSERDTVRDEVILVVTLLVSLLLILSYVNLCGPVGKAINYIIFGLIGVFAYLFPFALFFLIAFTLSNKGNVVAKKKLFSGIGLLVVMAALLQLVTGYESKMGFFDYFIDAAKNRHGGGLIGGLLVKILCPFFGTVAAALILVALLFICIILLTGKAIFAYLGQKSGESLERHRERRITRQEERDEEEEYFDDPIPITENRRKLVLQTTVGNSDILSEEQNTSVSQSNFLDSLKQKGKGVNTGKSPKTEEKNKLGAIVTEDKADEGLKRREDSFISINGDYHLSEETLDSVNSIYEEELKRKFGTESLSHHADNFVPEEFVVPQVHAEGSNLSTYIVRKEDRNIGDGAKASSADTTENKTLKEVEKDSSISQSTIAATGMTGVVEESRAADRVEVPADLPEVPWIEEDSSKDAAILFNRKQSSKINEKMVPNQEIRPSKNSKIHTDTASVDNNSQQNAAAQIPLINLEIPQPEPKKYEFPPIDLLTKAKPGTGGMSDKELKETAMKLQTTLESFGVRVTITNISCGPAVTRYELQPEQGVKVSRITGLADDIKLNLAAEDVRIEAPIPGKAAVGIEVPNKENSAVLLRELLDTKDFKEHSSDIAFAVGKDIGGQAVVTDIAKMPHLLIAGATGSGKSVCINTLIMSILYKAHPADVRLIMVDPKVVELSIYNGIPHLLIPVVTDPKKASAALNWAVMEMTERYKKFAEMGVRDLRGYNEKVKEIEELHDPKYQKMPQIVIIVDELADLMMVAPGEVEDAICRLAQMARAAGLHLIIATQRPSVNVITGLIKANVPSRIAFSVSSAIDSRTIIDGSGAEKLLGKGDMLFFPSGYSKPVRVQGAFVSDKEVGAVVDYLKEQNAFMGYGSEDMTNRITNVQITIESAASGGSDRDDFFIEAGKFIIEKDKASIGMLQRVYKIGFNRAARIMDQLTEAGVVGPEEGTKPRKVLMSLEEFEQFVDEYV